MLTQKDFTRDATDLARYLLGKVLRVKYQHVWLSVQVIETEAYYRLEKASHSSLGFTEKRRAMFMPAGTIYMYHSRAGASLNISSEGEGDAVLIKSGIPFFDRKSPRSTLSVMQTLNPNQQGGQRESNRLCRGQSLLCRSLGLTVSEWDQRQFNAKRFFIEDCGIEPNCIIQSPRLGIPEGRDEHLLLRFIDCEHAPACTRNPLTVKKWRMGQDYFLLHANDESR